VHLRIPPLQVVDVVLRQPDFFSPLNQRERNDRGPDEI